MKALKWFKCVLKSGKGVTWRQNRPRYIHSYPHITNTRLPPSIVYTPYYITLSIFNYLLFLVTWSLSLRGQTNYFVRKISIFIAYRGWGNNALLYLLNLPTAVILFAYIEPLVWTAEQSTIYQNTILNVWRNHNYLQNLDTANVKASKRLILKHYYRPAGAVIAQ